MNDRGAEIGQKADRLGQEGERLRAIDGVDLHGGQLIERHAEVPYNISECASPIPIDPVAVVHGSRAVDADAEIDFLLRQESEHRLCQQRAVRRDAE